MVAGLWPLVALAPIALVGSLLAWIPYRLVKPLAWRAAGGAHDIVGTEKLLVGSFLFGSTYLGWGLAAAWTLAPDPTRAAAASAAALVLGPLTGLAAASPCGSFNRRWRWPSRRELVATVESALGKGQARRWADAMRPGARAEREGQRHARRVSNAPRAVGRKPQVGGRREWRDGGRGRFGLSPPYMISAPADAPASPYCEDSDGENQGQHPSGRDGRR